MLLMKKRTIIYISCVVAVALIIAFAVYFIIRANKSENQNVEQKIVIEKFNEDLEVEKTIETLDKTKIEEINKMLENSLSEQDNTIQNIWIKEDIKLDLGNEKHLIIQLDLEEYCYYEDANSNTKLVIKMPEGLLEKVNNILAEN